MTNLTEQWKKGELPEGWYYVKGSRAEGIYAYTAEYLNNMYRPKNSDRIIERVPSYEEYQKLLSDQLAKNEGEEINAELKELLKECLPYISRSLTSRMIKNSAEYKKDMKLLTKINQVLGEE